MNKEYRMMKCGIALLYLVPIHKWSFHAPPALGTMI